MPGSNQIGWFIRSCRESKGISQDYMADMLDIAQSAYAYLESGKTSISIDRLIRISEILELDIHQLLDKILQFRSPPYSNVVNEKSAEPFLNPDTKEAYDRLIQELHSEIGFLRDLVKRN